MSIVKLKSTDIVGVVQWRGGSEVFFGFFFFNQSDTSVKQFLPSQQQ